MAAATGDVIERTAIGLATSPDRASAVAQLLALAGGDRAALEAARNRLTHRLQSNAGDYSATAALTLLNKALVEIGWVDPFDWKIRWSQRFKRP